METYTASELKLLKQAGFVFWEDESWGPGSDYIDWGSDYDQEVKRLISMTIDQCAKIVDHIDVQGGGSLGDLIRERMNHA